MIFENLLKSIALTHEQLQEHVVKAINLHITIRNWLIGFYMVEYEQNGDDRAQYGERLTEVLAEKLAIKGLSSRNLRSFRLFYQVYPQVVQMLERIDIGLDIPPEIWQTVSAKSLLIKTHNIVSIPIDKLLLNLSFSHFIELLQMDDPIKRTFYELECIKGTWSIRTLKRQIHTLYFERAGLSRRPELLSELVQGQNEPSAAMDIIKSPYTFEFLGLKAKEVVYESDLEKAIIENLEMFLLELGHGFCFEARQHKILIGDEYFFIDLVFYHRILKCHVLVELKIDQFDHNHLGQLNTYVNFFKAKVMRKDDQPPIGILLVTDKNKSLVEYALAGMDNQLFVSKYLTELPDKQQLLRFINREIQKL
jgi:predicted nuclease of restriction endonuclease-like (RecB) superfamily